MSTAAAATRGFPGTLYDGDGTRLAGDGPEFTSRLAEALPHKALVRGEPGEAGEVAVLESSNRLWLLPDTLGTPPEPPVAVLAALAEAVRRGRKVALAGRDAAVYTLVRDALVLLLDDSGGHA